MRLHCRGDKPGVRPGGRVTFFASPKKVTKKRRPGDRAPLRGVPVSAVRLLAASLAVGSGDTVTLGLQFRLQPGWKVYWRTPGDAGVAPRLACCAARSCCWRWQSW
jgi:DsbC/DsbD-like thiol-disulfide interchange protein